MSTLEKLKIWRKKLWVVWVALALLLAGASGCAKKRRAPAPAPVPAPVPAPTEVVPEAPGPSSAASPAALPLVPPSECESGPRAPWLRCTHTSWSGETLLYYLFLPASPVKEALPAITILHGSSGSGPGEGEALSGGHRFATDLWIREDVQARHPSIVVVPQAEPAAGETWVRFWRAPSVGDARPKEALVLVMEVLAMLERRYPVDRRRLYLTGQSMGGFGAWLAYTRYPGHFAAIVPVCGGGDPGAVVRNPTAVWAFHGDGDTVVPVSRAREMVAAIVAAGALVRYSELPGRNHNIFAESYAEPELLEWLFAQRLPQAPGEAR
ncbi:MAG: alpha/beta hydrolase-fold protein [Bryobacterales bacterium]|nr:alpha/beta hydrolase-fold protein [Bryobacterales bacterium]